jgi:hypothetical protein
LSRKSDTIDILSGGISRSKKQLKSGTTKKPIGGGWIHMNKKLQVTTKTGQVWGNGVCFAVGDCNFGCVGGPSDWGPGGAGEK